MAGYRIDMRGKVFGSWTAIAYDRNGYWRCRCSCGIEKSIYGMTLRRGTSTRCSSCRSTAVATTHGESKTRLYNIWCGIKARCLNPNEDAYPRYGGRGIAICDEWVADYPAFREWALSNGYEPHLTIERKDNDRGYSPDNCRWATYSEQGRNTSRNRWVVYRGRNILICDLAAEVGLPQDIIKNRITRYGWSVEEAVSTPVGKKGWKRSVACTFRCDPQNIDSIPVAQPTSRDETHAGTL